MNIQHSFAFAFSARDAVEYGMNDSFYKHFEEFRAVIEKAESYLNLNVLDLICNKEKLDQKPKLKTICLIVYCFGIYKIMEKHFGRPAAAAGFSQGEFTSLLAGGCLTLPETLNMVCQLEELLFEDEMILNGFMARVIGIPRELLHRCCLEVDPDGTNVSIAIFFTDDQNIISGRREEVLLVVDMAKKRGARWVINLGAGAFHSPLCQSVLEMSDKIFRKYSFQDAAFDLYSNIDGGCSTAGESINKKLSVQISKPILWDKLIRNIRARGIKKVIELGPGCMISGNSRNICSEISYMWINHSGDIEKAALFLRGR